MKRNHINNFNNTFHAKLTNDSNISYKINKSSYIDLNSSHDSFDEIQIFKNESNQQNKRNLGSGAKNQKNSGQSSRNKEDNKFQSYKNLSEHFKFSSQHYPSKKEEISKKFTEEKNDKLNSSKKEVLDKTHNNSIFTNNNGNISNSKPENTVIQDIQSFKNLYLAVPVPKVEVISSLQNRLCKIETSFRNLPQIEELNEKVKLQNEKITILEENIKSYQIQSLKTISLIEENIRLRNENSQIQNVNDKLIKIFLGTHKLIINIDQLISTNFEQSYNNQSESDPKMHNIMKENARNQASCFFCKQIGHTTSECKTSNSNNQAKMDLDN
jgi:hypothetical protein